MPKDPVSIRCFRREVKISGPDSGGDIVLDVETDDGWFPLYLDKTTALTLLHELQQRTSEQ